ncbi:MAG: glycosyltransferase family 1 protein, partial [Thermoplasmata archaeon]|nr:glycosyltransferase family 1 protein [Thermoplasmata archaeon]
LVGGLVGSAAPALLRWHIPLDFRGYPEPVRRFFLKAMEGFDGIVVSTRAGLEDLIQAGFQGRAFQVYPYFDPREQRAASASARSRVQARLKLGEGPVVLAVGRMDPVKRQDLAIDAFVRVA